MRCENVCLLLVHRCVNVLDTNWVGFIRDPLLDAVNQSGFTHESWKRDRGSRTRGSHRQQRDDSTVPTDYARERI